jgi:glycosyltransferase involved in cell wall biosynthesis
MRIGIDARELGGRSTGVGRWLDGLLREWATSAQASAHEFVLYAAEPLAMPLDARRFRTREVAGAPGTWWEQVRLPLVIGRDALDVFFAPGYTAPLRLRVPLVAIIHDLSFVAHPEWFRLREGIRRRWLTEHTARAARAIITVSDFSRREIVDRFGVPEGRLHTVRPGIDRPALARAGGDEPRLLYVGSVFNRRHVPDLIHSAARLMRSRPDISLDIVGDDRTFPREDLDATIARLGVDGRVRWHRYVSEERLLDLYGRARAFAFLSEYEGLGMTPLEALAAGVPPVVADTAVAHEAYGDAAVYAAVGDRAAVAAALERVLFDEATRAAISAAAPSVLARYDWPRAAQQTLAVIEATAARA